jgi:hypothetical protein
MIFIFILINKSSNNYYYHKSIKIIKYYLKNTNFIIINIPVDNNNHQINHNLLINNILNNQVNDNDFIVRFYYNNYEIIKTSNFFKHLANTTINPNIYCISRNYFFDLIAIHYSIFKQLTFLQNDNNSSYELKWEKIKNSISNQNSINLDYLGINLSPISNSIFTIY